MKVKNFHQLRLDVVGADDKQYLAISDGYDV